ncbi:hypothetical protein PR003_g5380 [Phytophthora rubi]|uniref:Uncharacterized protein n=1 Tax=Phytophthora rubi TaxID=129364 RepID=A0A6A3N4Y9_9STRA|nr:hypothetical protein PR002_g4949 [Phytophthora rubi]KAE9350388.1 hypothetical protein PR003_g5380 [Phytophthora rubi]
MATLRNGYTEDAKRRSSAVIFSAMARRLMSRRGGSASQPEVTPYQQIELDDGWREWENTKQDLALLKKQLTEKVCCGNSTCKAREE